MKLSLPFLLGIIVLAQNGFTQNLTGTWKGVFNDYKLVIIQKEDSLFGYTYDTGRGFCQAHFIGKYFRESKIVQGENTGFIKRSVTHGLSTYALNYFSDKSNEYLEGSQGSKGILMKALSFGNTESVAYKKVSNEVDSTDFMIRSTTKYIPPVMIEKEIPIVVEDIITTSDTILIRKQQQLIIEKEKRTTNILKRIETMADSITLRLYDNGTIDHDTVTVIYNGNIIVNKLGLTATVFEIKIPVNESLNVQRIELMANNLGKIPPNTAHLEILAGKDKYTLSVSADFTINAGIDVLYTKENTR